MIGALLPQAASVMLAGAVLVASVTTALSPVSIVKRLVGVLMALIAASLGAAAIGAPAGVIVAIVALILAYAAVGAALLVVLQESYGVSETTEIDAADAEADSVAEFGA